MYGERIDVDCTGRDGRIPCNDFNCQLVINISMSPHSQEPIPLFCLPVLGIMLFLDLYLMRYFISQDYRTCICKIIPSDRVLILFEGAENLGDFCVT